MNALDTALLALVQAEASGTPRPAALPQLDEPFGALVRFRGTDGELHGFAGRLHSGPTLEETVLEATRMAIQQDPRFGPAGRREARSAELFLVQLGGDVTAEDPLLPGEGVFVWAEQHRAVMLPEAGESPEEVLRRACIAAVLSPEAHRDGRTQVRRLRIRRIGETLLSATLPGIA